MKLLRTPDDRFTDLTDFPYDPHYVDLSDGVRVAYVEAGEGPPVLLLHGEPSWSYLYRTMIPVLAAAGFRAIAPDLVGFGRSDKPVSTGDHSYERHVGWMRELAFDVLDLHDVTLVGQDWGGLIGLRLVAENADRFAAVVAANTGLPTGDTRMPDVWWSFREAVEKAPVLDIGRFVQSGCRTKLAPEVLAAYNAPFPNETYKSGPRAMPGLVPNSPDDPASEANRAAWATLTKLDLPFLCAFSDSDPITGPMSPILQRVMAGAAGLEHPVIADAGHFLQEDAGVALAEAVVRFRTG
ncbi:haloalkane dehalogenase [Amycolatopsis xylanica]|uniref:Haloalkane dehalogenase n=1 Tax=Amycolatopsis xylanica TaxID=589385 RepID=A0A1H3STG0_9PSEU|nr:haloalkane dehalogenase [Amycolatopsis xylanica]SDZ41224.1 haloalkane dehalogenase [Amycolatopsis xylanica]